MISEVERIRKQRSAEYGTPAENFKIFADLMNAYFQPEKEFTPEDMGIVGILHKLSRQRFKHTKDNLIDICGYADTINEVHEGNK